MEVPALLRDLAAGRLPRLLLIHGPDPFLVEEVLDRLSAAVFPDPAAVGWGREVLHADSVAPDALVAAGRALPLWGPRKLVVVRGVAETPARVLERLRTALEAARRAEGGWPAEGVSVVFVAPGLDRRSPALRLVGEAGQVEVRPPTGRALAGWLRERARAVGLDLAPGAAEALTGLVGEEPSRLAGELEKLRVFVGDDGRVTAESVRALVGPSRATRYWELAQAVESGDRTGALAALEALLAAREEPTVVLGQLAAALRGLWRVQAGLAQGWDAREVARVLRRPEWVAERLMARVAALGAERFAAGLRACFEAERALKSGGAGGREASARGLLTALVAALTQA